MVPVLMAMPSSRTPYFCYAFDLDLDKDLISSILTFQAHISKSHKQWL